MAGKNEDAMRVLACAASSRPGHARRQGELQKIASRAPRSRRRIDSGSGDRNLKTRAGRERGNVKPEIPGSGRRRRFFTLLSLEGKRSRNGPNQNTIIRAMFHNICDQRSARSIECCFWRLRQLYGPTDTVWNFWLFTLPYRTSS
jgi:hypothetical protein